MSLLPFRRADVRVTLRTQCSKQLTIPCRRRRGLDFGMARKKMTDACASALK
jgi:hypothetical protein